MYLKLSKILVSVIIFNGVEKSQGVTPSLEIISETILCP